MINISGKHRLHAVEFDKHNAKVNSTRFSLIMTVSLYTTGFLSTTSTFDDASQNNYSFIATYVVVSLIYIKILLN